MPTRQTQVFPQAFDITDEIMGLIGHNPTAWLTLAATALIKLNDPKF
jgi:hypothetical protein